MFIFTTYLNMFHISWSYVTLVGTVKIIPIWCSGYVIVDMNYAGGGLPGRITIVSCFVYFLLRCIMVP